MLNRRPRQRLILLSLSALVGGIVGGVMGAGSPRMPPPPILRHAAEAVLVGQAYDGAAKAVQNEDTDQIVLQAAQFDGIAETLTGAARLTQQSRAANFYRTALGMAALRPSPQFNSSDPEVLNDLGYFLADRGQSPADFKEAERLTRHSIQLRDSLTKQLDTDDNMRPLKSLLAPQYKLGRALTRDSLAWALFKEGQYAAALPEQEGAVADYAAVAKDGPQNASLHFHLGEIYRALNRPNDARLQYQQALRLDPKDAASQRALTSLPNGK